MASVIAQMQAIIKRYEAREEIDLSAEPADAEHALTRFLLYYQMPLWTFAGLLDWWWHKDTDIEHTAGVEESLIHSLMFTEVGLPILMGLFWEINTGVLATMFGAFVLHELTAFWDVGYAVHHREVKTREQHTHSLLEVLPLMALAMASCLHWDQARSLVGKGTQPPDFHIRFKSRKLPKYYIGAIAAMMLGGVALPYGNELYRCLKARNEPHYNSGFYDNGKRCP